VTAVVLGHSAKGRRHRRMHKALAGAAIILIAAPAQHASAAEGQTRRVEIKDIAFMPAQVTVHAGDTMEWDNDDIVAHTATSKEAGFDVAVLPGRRGSAVLTRPGTFSYTCRYHPNMGGQITVEPRMGVLLSSGHF